MVANQRFGLYYFTMFCKITFLIPVTLTRIAEDATCRECCLGQHCTCVSRVLMHVFFIFRVDPAYLCKLESLDLG